ncbi:MAG: SDR family oxidoreductase [Candidatus Omnitrophica bacterium]|nr:SDR family oxidoreductase [Candidatus Omnitrophota bacterium]
MESNPPYQERKSVLITGASAGIGLEFARLFARKGYDLILISRNKARLEAVAQEIKSQHALHPIKIYVLAKDLSKPLAPGEIFIELTREQWEPDVLINNAGFGLHGTFLETDLDEELEMMELNMGALVHLTKLFLPRMAQRGWGKIMNVASTAAFQAGPMMAIYYATKAFVLSFSEALHNELNSKGVSVTCLCPGPTESEFRERAGMKDSKLFKLGMMSASKVAEIGYEGMMKGKSLVIPGFKNKLLAFGNRFVSRSFSVRLVRLLQDKISQSEKAED